VLVPVRKVIFRVVRVTSNSVGGRWGRFIGLNDLRSAGGCSPYGGYLHSLVSRLEILADLISGSWLSSEALRPLLDRVAHAVRATVSLGMCGCSVTV